MQIRNLSIILIVALVAVSSCSKEKKVNVKNYTTKLAGLHMLSGNEHLMSTILRIDSTYDCSIKINITVLNDSTIVTSCVDTNILPAYAGDTLHYRGGDPFSHTLTFENSLNLIDDGFNDLLTYNYENGQLEQMYNGGGMAGELDFDFKGQ